MPDLSRKILDVALRFTSILLFVMLFIPVLNPARITMKINRNLSLFTSGLFYNNLVADIGRFFDKGWILQSTMSLLFFSSLAACIGIFSCCVGSCASLGNDKLKRIGLMFNIAGSTVTGLSLFGIIKAHAQLLASTEIEKVMPNYPIGIQILLVLSLFVFALSVVRFFLAPVPNKDEKCHLVFVSFPKSGNRL